MIRKYLATTTASVGAREVVVVASTGEIDRAGEIVEQEGIDLSSFNANPIILWNHDPAHPVGTAASVSIGGGKLRATIEFAPEGVSEIADTTCALVKSGIVTGVSIGFDPVEMEPMNPAQPRGPQRYLKSELLEISFVAIPANTGAGVVQRAFARHRAADTVAALHRRWRAEGMPSYRDRVAEVREAFGLGAPRVREISLAERQADLIRLADAGARRELKAAPVFRGDVATYAAEMRAFIERETLKRSRR